MEKAGAFERELKTLRRFTEVYCRAHHRKSERNGLCPECRDLVEYGEKRLQRCPYDPKPKCKDCQTHCFKPEYRQKVKEVMRYSGMHFVKRGRVDWLVRYFM